MKIAFFTARRIHQQYFDRLCHSLQVQDTDAYVIWHKSL